MQKEIPILSIHDSFAVQARYADETWRKMNEIWDEIIFNHCLLMYE
jgi:hypothetical protein